MTDEKSPVARRKKISAKTLTDEVRAGRQSHGGGKWGSLFDRSTWLDPVTPVSPR